MWREIRRRFEHYRMLSRYVVNHRTLALRKILKPFVRLRLWVRTTRGTCYYLSDDPMDDVVFESIVETKRHVYFPTFRGSWPQGGIILDVGAWHGFYAVEVLRQYPGSYLIAVEPDSFGCTLLRRNLGANRLLERAEVVEAGVGRESGFATLMPGRNSLDKFTVVQGINQEKYVPRGPVRLLTAGEVLRGRTPLLVKCNAQGAEYTLFPQLFESGIFPPLVVVEIHPGFGPPEELRSEFRRVGYSVELVEAMGREGLHGWYHCWRV